MTLTGREFAEKLMPYGLLAAERLEVEREYVKVFVTQWAHESGFESPQWVGHHNYAGITKDGPPNFLKYPSIQAFVEHYVQVLKRTYGGDAYRRVLQLMHCNAPIGQVLTALGESPWDAGHYGENFGLRSGELLHRRYRELLPYFRVDSTVPLGPQRKGDRFLEVFQVTGPGSVKPLSAYAVMKAWAEVVPGAFGGTGPSDFVVYNRYAGEGSFYTMDALGAMSLTRRHRDWRTTWTQIVPGQWSDAGTTGLLFFDPRAGQVELYAVDAGGGLEMLGAHALWKDKWVHLVPGNFTGGYTGLLAHLPEDGVLEVYSTDGKGGLSLVRRHQNVSPTWSQVIPGQFSKSGFTDLLCYSAATGKGEFFRSDGQGGLKPVRMHSDWRRTWGHVRAGRFGGTQTFDGLCFYDPYASLVEFYATDGQGNLELLGTRGQWGRADRFLAVVPPAGGASMLVAYDCEPFPVKVADGGLPTLPDVIAVPDPTKVPLPATDPWLPWDAPIRSGPGRRSPELLEAVIRQCHVRAAPRYQPRNGNTYCNIFLWDVTEALGVICPHWVKEPGLDLPSSPDLRYVKARETDANMVCDWLAEHGQKYGWSLADAAKALAFANAGRPAIAVWKNPGGIGHVAVVRPGWRDPEKGVPIAQAGATNFDDGYLTDGFRAGRAGQVIYYVNN